MTRSSRFSLPTLIICQCAVPLLLAGPLSAQSKVERVEVVNLPKVQTVEGQVEVSEPIPQTALRKISQDVVSPVGPGETTAMVLAGTLESAGFGTAVLSLAGSVQAARYRSGEIGAILVPDVELARTAFLEEGELLFPLRVEAGASAQGAVYFSSDQPEFRLGFDRYRVYFYNTTDRPATVTLFAYLGN
jgi:hypothetical protein